MAARGDQGEGVIGSGEIKVKVVDSGHLTEEWYGKSHLCRDGCVETDGNGHRRFSLHPQYSMSQAALRLERFRQAEAALYESLRIENRHDLDVTHQKHRMNSTLEHSAAKPWFIEYLQMQTPQLDPQRYFDADHPPPDRVLLKKYAIFMAQSRVGHIADTISVRTLINYVRLLFTVFGIDRGCRLDTDLTDDIQAYIYNDMAKEYQLSREQWKKPVAHSEDLTYLISV